MATMNLRPPSWVGAFVFVFVIGCATTTASPVNSPPELPAPLVDREVYFDDPELTAAQLSPDGAFITFMKPYHEVRNLWVKGRAEPFERARPLTADARPISRYFWSHDGKYVLYVQDRGGDENFHVYAVDPKAAPAATGVPEQRDLTPGDKLRAEIIALPKRTPDVALVGLNDRDPEVHDVYRLSLSTGKRELVRLNRENVAGWTADLDGNLRLATKMNDAGGTEVLRVNQDSLEPLTSCSAEESCGPVRFHKDGRRVYFETNRGAVDLVRLVLLDVATGREELVEGDPEKQVDLSDVTFSEVTDELSATMYLGDRLRTYPKTTEFRRDFEAVRSALPKGDVFFLSSTNDERFQLAAVDADVAPGAVYLYERPTGKVELLFRPRPRLPVETLVPMKPVRITSRDGVVLPAYLSRPRGATGPGPAVVLVHGGPWSRDAWGYDGEAQFLANRGFTVLQVNFRGSTGYGKKFLNLGNGQWGTGSMQNDLTDARGWLVKEGYAAEGKIAIMGGSYGGYATLAALAFTPDLWAAGVDIVGPSNIVTLLRSIPPYWGPVKKMFAVRVGDLDKPEELARLEAQSPLGSAKAIKAPLLVIQGANDPRVKRAEADQIVVALRDQHHPVEYLVAPDEGHGFRGRLNRLAMMVAIERFLGEHLHGRVQQAVAPQTAEKLTALTVDIAKVTLAPAGPVVKLDPPVFSGSTMKSGAFKYNVSGTMAGRQIEGVSAVTVSKGPKGWTLSSVDTLPFGETSDVVTLDAKTLLPIAQTMKQGPATVELAYTKDSVKGAVKAGPQTIPVEAKADGVLVVGGAVLGMVAGTLPLKVGYRVGMSAFDLGSGKVQALALEVTDAEKTTVAAGTFDAWKIAVTADGVANTTLWVEQSGLHRLLKINVVLPQGQGSLSEELASEKGTGGSR